MAWDFAAQIHSLSGFDADGTGTSDVGGETFVTLAAQWLTDSAKEIIDLMPPHLTERCAKTSAASANFTNGTGITTENKVVSVIRTRNTEGTPQFDNPGDVFVCRQIPHTLSYKALDPNSIEYATETDPVFYYEPQTDGTAVLLKVLPSSGAAITKATTIDYPAVDEADTLIANFPDELDYLVPLRASLYAAVYQAVIEEDPELYLPIIQNLKQDYQQALQSSGLVQAQPQQAGR